MTTELNDLQASPAADTDGHSNVASSSPRSTVKDLASNKWRKFWASWKTLPMWARDCLTAAVFAVGWFGGFGFLESTPLWYPWDIGAYWRVGAWVVFILATRRLIPRTSFWLVIILFPPTYSSYLGSFFHFLPLMLAGYYGTRYTRISPVITGIATALSTLAFLVFIFNGPIYVPGARQLYLPQLWYIPETLAFTRPSRMAMYLSMTVGSVVLGAIMRRLALTSQDLADRNRELERLRAVESQRAVAVERTRIARELHDVITHHLTAIVIRAQAANRVAGNTPEAPGEAVQWIAEAGRECLTSLRSIVTVLKDDDESGSRMLSAPVLEDIYDAADRMTHAGLHVQVNFPDVHPQYPPLMELALVRITQEALTNVLKHSTARSATVTLTIKSDLVILTIHDPGPQRSTDWSESNPGVGSGLTNMTQRAEAVNGALIAGPDGAGGWLVRAALPSEPSRTDRNATATAIEELEDATRQGLSGTNDAAPDIEQAATDLAADTSFGSNETAQFTTSEATEELPALGSDSDSDSDSNSDHSTEPKGQSPVSDPENPSERSN